MSRSRVLYGTRPRFAAWGLAPRRSLLDVVSVYRLFLSSVVYRIIIILSKSISKCECNSSVLATPFKVQGSLWERQPGHNKYSK